MSMVKPLRKAKGTAKAEASALAGLFHALSDETRLAIVERLRNGEQCVCNLADILGAGQSRLSFHMKTLKDAGLVLDRREGRWIHYSLSPEALDTLGEFLASVRKGAAEVAACCPK
jgi:ArsR family transcriptional regulator